MLYQKVIHILACAALAIPALPPALFPFFQPYTFGKTTLFEIIVEAMAIVWLSARFFRAWTIFTRPYLVKIVLPAFAIITTISTFFADNPVAGFWGSSARMDGLFTLIHFFSFFVILAASCAENAWRRLMLVSVGAGTFAAIYGIAQWFGAPFVVASRGEIFGTLGNPSYLALYLLFTLFLAYHLAQNENKREVAILLYCAASLQVIALLLTQVQAAFLALTGGAVIALWPYIRGRITFRRSAVALISISALIFLFSFSAHFTKLASLSEGSASLANRIAVWRIALSGIAEKPLFGHGANNFEPYYLAQKNTGSTILPATGETFDKPHNSYLELAFSYGIIGLAAYLFFAWEIMRRARAFPVLRAALVAYVVFLFFFFDTFASLLMFFFVVAFLFSPPSSEESGDIAAQKTVSPVAFVAGGIALTAIFFALHFKPLYSAYFARQFLIHTTSQTADESLKAKALRYRTFNTPFVERAIFLTERTMKK